MARRFDWDPDKAKRNLAKHRVSFALAVRIWDDPLLFVVPDRFEDGEQRWHALGSIDGLAILVVVHVYPDASEEEHIRIIGARKATRHERRRYEEEA